ncbi:hypothetical protein CsatB_025408 [Cannabis sativa]
MCFSSSKKPSSEKPKDPEKSKEPEKPKEPNAESRMRRELEIKQEGEYFNMSSILVNYKQVAKNDLFRFIGTIIGPSDTPYEGGVFKLSIKIPRNYPFSPPEITFITKVFHPNISKNGFIHVNILHNDWTPGITIEVLLLAICSLLDDPNPEDPVNPICILYREDIKAYHKKAREWTKKYAMSY